jgi:metal-responsive CopG/Arc/MetJ family transcriptional regulator
VAATQRDISIRFPRNLRKAVEEFIEEKPNLGFKSANDLIEYATRRFLELNAPSQRQLEKLHKVLE